MAGKTLIVFQRFKAVPAAPLNFLEFWFSTKDLYICYTYGVYYIRFVDVKIL